MTKLDKYIEFTSSRFLDMTGHDSKENLDSSFQTPLNWDIGQFRAKLHLFTPYFMEVVSTYESPRVAEIMSGNGTFLDLVAVDLPGSSTTYVARNRNSADMFRYLYGTIGAHNLVVGRPDASSFDVVISDGAINLMSSEELTDFEEWSFGSLAPGGVMCLLVNMAPEGLRPDFDLQALHARIRGRGLRCIHGMNTFSSLWKK
jgi:hypothetical protein